MEPIQTWLAEAAHHRESRGRPLVTLTYAQSLDGCISARPGQDTALSAPQSLSMTHELRARHDAILVGVETVLADDPELTVRLVRGRNPLRVVLDSRLRLPPGAKVLQDQMTARTLVATTPAAGKDRPAALHGIGVEAAVVKADGAGHIDLAELLKRLGERDITSVLVEGGAAVITSFLREGLADRVIAIIAPKIMGRGTETVGELNIKEVEKTIKLTFEKVYRSGADVVVEGRITPPP
jgi:diaminohydroxyphosphoribosylaminopyrimidine deaminase/5-amino-6-(5-phosphoribosylamino)uracil reductase